MGKQWRCVGPVLLTLLVTLLWAFPLQGKPCIAVVAGGAGKNYWQAVERGSQQAGKELGISIFFRYLHEEADASAQSKHIDEAFNKRCLGLVIAPNSTRQQPELRRFFQQHYPVVMIDRQLDIGPVNTLIATDNYQAGVLAATKLRQLLHDQGTVTVLRLQHGVASTDAREQGFIDEIHRSPLTLIESGDTGTNIRQIRQRAGAFLDRHLGELDGIFTPNEMTTLATLAELKKRGKAGTLAHIGFDYSQYQINALRAGELQGLVLQQPYQMGYLSVKLIYDIHQGRHQAQQVIYTPVFYLTADKLHSAEGEHFLRENGLPTMPGGI